MKLVAFYNKSYEPLKKRFLKSLLDDFELDIDFIPIKANENTPGGGRSIWKARTKWTADKIQKYKNEIVLFCDLDIQFFQPIKDNILALLNDNDILFQRAKPNRKPINIGVMVVKCNKKTETLWRLASNISHYYKIQDEDIINTLLSSQVTNPLQIKYDFLPLTYAITNYINNSTIVDLMLHHETSTRFIESKLEVMSKIKKRWEKGMREKERKVSRPCYL